MKPDYFSHCVFGVVLDAIEHAHFVLAYRTARDGLIQANLEARRLEGESPNPDHAEDDWQDRLTVLDLGEFETVLGHTDESVLAEIRGRVGAPPDASFYTTGDAEPELHRPGNCQTEAGLIVCGFGPFAVQKMVAEKFQAHARTRVGFESWVTGG